MKKGFFCKSLSSRCKGSLYPGGNVFYSNVFMPLAQVFVSKGQWGRFWVDGSSCLSAWKSCPLGPNEWGQLPCLWLWLQCLPWLPLEVCGGNVANEHELSLCFSVPRYSIPFHLFILTWQFVEMLAEFFLSCLLTYCISGGSAVCYLSLKHLSFDWFLASLLPCDLSSLMSLRKCWFIYYPAFHVAIVWVRYCALDSIIHLSRSLNSFPLSGRFSFGIETYWSQQKIKTD